MPTDEEWSNAVINYTVWPTGMVEGHFRPDGVPFAANLVHGIVRNAVAAATQDAAAPQWLKDGLAKLRDDALVLAQRIHPTGMIPEPTGEIGARIAEARAQHATEHGTAP